MPGRRPKQSRDINVQIDKIITLINKIETTLPQQTWGTQLISLASEATNLATQKTAIDNSSLPMLSALTTHRRELAKAVNVVRSLVVVVQYYLDAKIRASALTSTQKTRLKNWRDKLVQEEANLRNLMKARQIAPLTAATTNQLAAGQSPTPPPQPSVSLIPSISWSQS